MSTLGEAIVKEAREWIDTRFLWGQSVKGRNGGCDCKGLVAGVVRNIGHPAGSSLEALCSDYEIVDAARLRRGFERLFIEVPMGEVQLGDVMLMKMGGAVQHMGVCSDVADGKPTAVIHVYSTGPKRVREIPLGALVRTIDSVWRLPDVN